MATEWDTWRHLLLCIRSPSCFLFVIGVCILLSFWRITSCWFRYSDFLLLRVLSRVIWNINYLGFNLSKHLSPILCSYLMLGLQSYWNRPDGGQALAPAIQAPVYLGSHFSTRLTRSGIWGSLHTAEDWTIILVSRVLTGCVQTAMESSRKTARKTATGGEEKKISMEVVSHLEGWGFLEQYVVGKFLSISVVNAVFPGFVRSQEKDVTGCNLNFAPACSAVQICSIEYPFREFISQKLE